MCSCSSFFPTNWRNLLRHINNWLFLLQPMVFSPVIMVRFKLKNQKLWTKQVWRFVWRLDMRAPLPSEDQESADSLFCTHLDNDRGQTPMSDAWQLINAMFRTLFLRHKGSNVHNVEKKWILGQTFGLSCVQLPLKGSQFTSTFIGYDTTIEKTVALPQEPRDPLPMSWCQVPEDPSGPPPPAHYLTAQGLYGGMTGTNTVAGFSVVADWCIVAAGEALLRWSPYSVIYLSSWDHHSSSTCEHMDEILVVAWL